MMTRLSIPLGALTALLALALPAVTKAATTAVPIVFTYDGTGTGSIGGTSFTSKNFTIVVTANTGNVSTDGDTRLIMANTATVEIDGFPAATINVALRLFCNGIYSVPPGRSGDSTLGLSLASGPDLLNLMESEFTGYDFTTALASVFEPVPDYQSRLSFTDIATTLGGLTFTSTQNVTFTAEIVPEPGSFALIAIGSMAGLAVRSRRK